MPIDWAATGSMLGGIGAVGGAIAVGVAAWIGREELSKLRAKKTAERQFEAAESILAAAYNAQDAIAGIRANLMEGFELLSAEDALKKANEGFDRLDDAEKKGYISRTAIYRRAELYKASFDAVFEVLPLAKIFFDDQVEKYLKDLLLARRRVLVSADMLPDINKMDGWGKEDRDLAVQVRRDIYDGHGNEEDKVGKMVVEAVSQLNAKLLPMLRAEKS